MQNYKVLKYFINKKVFDLKYFFRNFNFPFSNKEHFLNQFALQMHLQQGIQLQLQIQIRMSEIIIDLDSESLVPIEILTNSPYLSLVIFLLTPDISYNSKVQSMCRYIEYLQSVPTIQTEIRIKNIESYTEKKYKQIAVGGTFDRLHLGHMVLLLQTILAASDKIYIGVTGEKILSGKSNRDLVQPMKLRMKKIYKFVKSIKPQLQLDIFELTDPYGPTIKMQQLQALVVSPETQRGGDKINQIRKQNQLKQIDVIICQTISHKEALEHKVSSTGIRQYLLKKNSMTHSQYSQYFAYWQQFIAKLDKYLEIGCDMENKQITADQWWQILFNKYSENWRYYHTNNHIFSLLKQWHGQDYKKERESLSQIQQLSVQAALFFHDIVYRPDQNTNQQDSAEQFNKFISQFPLQKDIKQHLSKTVSLLILQTKNHKPSTTLSQIVYDLDMGILDDNNNYKLYARNIKLEYEPLFKEHYPQKRIAFLNKVLSEDRHFSFHTQHLVDNIKWEIFCLQNHDL